MEAITVNVTQAHIDHGDRNNCDRCMVVLAILDAVPEARQVECNCDKASWREGPRTFTAIFPEGVAERISAFDMGEHVDPFTFAITPTH